MSSMYISKMFCIIFFVRLVLSPIKRYVVLILIMDSLLLYICRFNVYLCHVKYDTDSVQIHNFQYSGGSIHFISMNCLYL